MFAFRLAEAMGRTDVDAMLDEMTPHQLAEWRAYMDVVGSDPWQRAAQVCWAFLTGVGMVIRAFGGKPPELTPDQFLPYKLRRPGPDETEDQVASLEKGLQAMAKQRGLV